MQNVPYIPDNAPFNVAQRLWLNGFLAGLFAREAMASVAPAAEPAPAVSLLILFGSQTGTAEGLARRMANAAKTRGCQARVVDAAEHAKVDWKKESHLFVITSTYGEGDPPDNAQNFCQWLQTDAASVMAHLNFSVLALGDRTYTEFCAAGKKIDARLETLGATRIHPRSDCDVDYEPVAKAWMESAFAALMKPGPTAQPADGNGAVAANGHAVAPPETVAPKFSKTNPFPARLLKNICLNRPGSSKEVRHYEIGLQGSGLTYETGDALGIVPMNCPELAGAILSAARCGGDEAVRVGEMELPLRDALGRMLDITKPSSELLAAVARRSPGCELVPLLAPDRAADLKQWLYGRGVIDLLQFPCDEPFAAQDLVKCLRKLAPRLYSISSSPKAHPGEVHLTVSAVRYESHGRARKGVASTFLADRAIDAEGVRVFVQPSHGFKLPADGGVPIIMLGPGTGIAPFRAFLEERQALGATGRNWLFFGDQKRSTDFLYEEQICGWLKDGHLTRLELAFSRDQPQKIYVQQRMLENAETLWAWLQDGAHFYVCGDASRMAKDVDAALHRIAETTGGLGPDGAAAYVRKLKTDRRYQRDVY